MDEQAKFIRLWWIAMFISAPIFPYIRDQILPSMSLTQLGIDNAFEMGMIWFSLMVLYYVDPFKTFRRYDNKNPEVINTTKGNP